jgi:hypothetical protein
MDTVESWERLTKTLRHFSNTGFAYKDAPWMVPYEFNMATCPDELFLVESQVGYHVGSAEQSFICLDHNGWLEKGKYCALTPCFRNEFVLDELHQQGFMKVELYQTDDVTDEALLYLARACRWHYVALAEAALGGTNTTQECINLLETSEGFDIEWNGIELGSYGRRSWRGLTWLYGTALAEPRFSKALRRNLETVKNV